MEICSCYNCVLYSSFLSVPAVGLLQHQNAEDAKFHNSNIPPELTFYSSNQNVNEKNMPLSNEPLQHSSTSSGGPFLVNNSLPEPVAERRSFLVNNSLPEPVAERTVNASTFSPTVMPQHNDLEHLLSLAGFMKYNESQSLP
ncbi:hypothetical protein CEXT_316931 [Caerostris extrusa]|uniref:Uncharacterized protein n=1 Tax=Caerostris extrusa TaxID=172846 RepID=A0AAV4WEA2_CAEEX|nr:hypothetical protein CEXT_316931 [Caerostris extrusa]